KMTDADLWQMRSSGRKSLIESARQKLARQLAAQGASEEEIAAGRNIFDPDVFTIGFARRFATYKRPNLLLHDPERLLRILTNSHFPVQLVLAGKAHPQDLAGQAMIEQWFQFIRRPEAHAHAAFLNDYDMSMAEYLVQGVDLWINTPRRPWEACGTSGKKVLVNGGLNISELDGWWAEAYSPEVGWAIGDGKEHGDDPAWDAAEANVLYSLLEQEIIPAFYARDAHGIPTAWMAKMRESMARLTPRFSANRAVREYTENHYLPAAKAYQKRVEKDGALAVRMQNWSRQLEQHWPGLRFGEVKVETAKDQLTFTVQVYLGELDPDAVRVELYAEGVAGGASIRQHMERSQPLAGSASGYAYSATVPAKRPANDYTPRVVPWMEGASIPLEASQILWQR
ncbi:MAG: alpha-glucan family phosphorylase, partial [Acidobacteriaceae bacterium]